MSNATPPLNIAQLNSRLQEVARELSIPVACARLMLCTLIVSQMLPEAVAITRGTIAHLVIVSGRTTARTRAEPRVGGEVTEFMASLTTRTVGCSRVSAEQ